MTDLNRSYLEGIDDVIADAMKLMNVPGAAIAIVDNGEVVYQKAHGYADIDNKIELTENHYLPMGSSSKAFTATAATMLVADGKLAFDTPVKEYIPWLEFFDRITTQEATPRDLLCHRTGLPRHDLLWVGWPELKREDIVRKIRYMKPSLTFRDKFQYNNFMFVTAGYLIEAITGKKWEDFLAERIFGPLGIGEYGFLHPDPLPTDKYAKLYVPDEEGVNKETAPLRFEGMGPAGSILTPIGEAAKWLQFNLNGGKVGEEALIPPEIFAELYKPNIPYQLLPFQTPGNIEVGYALGWFVDSYHGNKKVEHGGNVDGGTANVAFLPDKGIGCVVLTNADSSTFPMAFTADLFDRFLGVKRDVNIYEHYHTEFKKVIEETMGALRAILDTKVEGKPCSHELDDYVGTYSHEAYGDTEVFIKDGELKAQLHGNFLDLEHLHYDTFTFEIFKMLTPMTFQTAVDGSIKSFETPLEQTVDPIVFTKAAAPEEKKEA